MKRFATRRVLSILPALMLLGAGGVLAQPGPPLGDDFIFFVNGTNVQVPSFEGEIVNDPLDAESDNRVMKYNYGNWSFQAFRFMPGVGVDLTANVDEGDMLHLRLLSDPANAGQPNVTISIMDKTDNSPADGGTADLEFRLQ